MTFALLAVLCTIFIAKLNRKRNPVLQLLIASFLAYFFFLLGFSSSDFWAALCYIASSINLGFTCYCLLAAFKFVHLDFSMKSIWSLGNPVPKMLITLTVMFTSLTFSYFVESVVTQIPFFIGLIY